MPMRKVGVCPVSDYRRVEVFWVLPGALTDIRGPVPGLAPWVGSITFDGLS